MISEVELETLDLDWFSVDEQGRLAHFATGGRGFFPEALRRSVVELRSLISFLRKHAKDRCEPEVSSGLDEFNDFPADRDRYLKDFLLFARRGLFSFDCMVLPIRPS